MGVGMENAHLQHGVVLLQKKLKLPQPSNFGSRFCANAAPLAGEHQSPHIAALSQVTQVLKLAWTKAKVKLFSAIRQTNLAASVDGEGFPVAQRLFNLLFLRSPPSCVVRQKSMPLAVEKRHPARRWHQTARF